MFKSAVFLDRDGVINKDLGYVFKIDDVEWISGSIEAIKLLNKKNFLVFVVTNQSGVARNFYSENDVNKLHRWMKNILKEKNAIINEFSYCPHHPDAINKKYRKEGNCRKPNPGMIDKIIKNWQIDRKSSFLIGDNDTDIEAAYKAKINGYKFTSNNLLQFVQNIIQRKY